MPQHFFKKIVIFGVGLIGGSFSLALRKVNAVGEVVGFGRSGTTLQQALQLGIIDRIGEDVAAEVGDADLVLLGTPVGQMAELELAASRLCWQRISMKSASWSRKWMRLVSSASLPLEVCDPIPV